MILDFLFSEDTRKYWNSMWQYFLVSSSKSNIIQGGPKRMHHLRSIISSKRGTEIHRMKKLCALFRIKFLFQQDDTNILILMKAFWFYGRFSEAMSFSRFALLSQKSQFMYRTFFIVWLSRVKCLLLLCKAKPAWIKRSIHYVTLPH